MASNSTLGIDGNYNFKAPASLKWSIQTISSADTGRDQDGLMQKDDIADKRKIELTWTALTKEDTHDILVAIHHKYINATFYDPLIGDEATFEMYGGDKAAPVYTWQPNGQKMYASLSVNLIER